MTESKAREFCKHNIHESHYCGSCNRDAINKLQSELKAKDELLQECEDLLGVAHKNLYFEGSEKYEERIGAMLQKIREGKK